MGKYAPLTRFLREQEKSRITMRFAELEEVLGFSLPASAYKYVSWWANSALKQSQVRGWRDAGWEARDVDLRGRKITFVRVSGEPVASTHAQSGGSMQGSAPGQDSSAPKALQPAAVPVARGASAAASAAGKAQDGGQDGGKRKAASALPAGALDVAKLPAGLRRLLAARAARHGRSMEQEAAVILQAALAEERAALLDELTEMRRRTQRAGAFDLLQVLGRR